MSKFILLILLLIFYSQNSIAKKIDVVFAGFSINADYKDLEKSFPF